MDERTARPVRRFGWRTARRDLLCLAFALLALAMFAYGKSGAAPGLHGPVTFDGDYYAQIGEHGYAFDGYFERKQNTAFLPLMGLVIQAARMLIPGQAPMAEIAALGFVILFLTLLGIYRLAHVHGGASAATVAVALWALSPLGFYNFAGYADPLYALMTVWGLIWIMERRYWGACLLAGLALLARPQALVLAGFVAFALLWSVRADWRRVLSTTAPMQLAVIALPLLAFATYCALAFGDSTVYVNSLEAWRNGSFLDGNLPIWRALPYFVDAASEGGQALTPWTALLASTALASAFGIVFFTLHAARIVAAFYMASVSFLFLTLSFDALNLARHLFFLAPWAILAAVAHVRSLPRWWARLPVLLAWFGFSIAMNLEAVGRYYRGEWVS